jgi:hypothetical protein
MWAPAVYFDRFLIGPPGAAGNRKTGENTHER